MIECSVLQRWYMSDNDLDSFPKTFSTQKMMLKTKKKHKHLVLPNINMTEF